MVANCSKVQTVPNCMDTCMTTKSWTLDCRVHNCFLSTSLNSPQDHDSHCGHANGKNGKCQ
jgi:hypothetical protein